MSTQSPLHQTLGAVVQRRRTDLGLTQAALADRVAACGDWTIRQSDISRLERGVVTLPHAPRLRFLAAALEVPPGDLLVSSGWAGAPESLDIVELESDASNGADNGIACNGNCESSIPDKQSTSSDELMHTLEQVLQDLSAVRQALERVTVTTSRLLAEVDSPDGSPKQRA